MKTTMKLKKQPQERKMEWYEAEISFSEADKDLLKDLPAFMKQLLEKAGHQVRRVVVSTEFEKLAQAAVTRGGARNIRIAHIVYPDSEASLWIEY